VIWEDSSIRDAIDLLVHEGVAGCGLFNQGSAEACAGSTLGYFPAPLRG
jgi:hypothetical protein